MSVFSWYNRSREKTCYSAMDIILKQNSEKMINLCEVSLEIFTLSIYKNYSCIEGGLKMLNYVWPVLLVVISNVVYQICAKGVPKDMDVMASMTVTYLVGAVCSGIMFFIMNRNGNLIHEYNKLNAAPVLLGISVVGLEVGFIYAYKTGWPVSTLSTVQSAFLALALIIVGSLLYKEEISLNKVIGIVICLIGLYFINKK